MYQQSIGCHPLNKSTFCWKYQESIAVKQFFSLPRLMHLITL